jgi:hypothetical protein
MSQQVVLRAPTAQEVAQAKLPARYEAARTAIAECDRIDELKDLADRQAALASYARQVKDDSLRLLALRIQARAERRCGELLKQIPSGSASNLVQHRRAGTVPSVTRTDAAEAAGLSPRQRKTVLRIANVPQEVFERQLESDRPPTMTQLAQLGTAARPAEQVVEPAGFDPTEADETQSALRYFAEFCADHDPAMNAGAIALRDAPMLREFVLSIDAWLDRFVTNLQVAGES